MRLTRKSLVLREDARGIAVFATYIALLRNGSQDQDRTRTQRSQAFYFILSSFL